MTTAVINLLAGPGTGKSTTAAYLFALFKLAGRDCELVREYAKDLVWEGSTHRLEDQLYLLAEQSKRMRDLDGKVELIITDSPLLLTMVYCDDDLLHQLAMREYEKYHNFNFFLQRKKVYNPNGRVQTEEEARELDSRILTMLRVEGLAFDTIDADVHAPAMIKRVVDALWL